MTIETQTFEDGCCENGGGTLTIVDSENLQLRNDTVRTNAYAVKAGEGDFVRGEVVLINAGGEIEKATAGNAVAGALLRVAAYGFTNTAAAVAAGNATAKATVFVQGLLNSNKLVLPSGVTVAGIKPLLAASGIEIDAPVSL